MQTAFIVRVIKIAGLHLRDKLYHVHFISSTSDLKYMCEHQRLWTQINSVVRIGSGQEGKATRCSITVADLPHVPH